MHRRARRKRTKTSPPQQQWAKLLRPEPLGPPRRNRGLYLRTVDVDEDLGESDVRVGAGTTPRRGRRKSRGKSSVSGDSDSAAAAAAAACGGGSSANEDSALRIKLPSFLLGGAIDTAVDSSKQQNTSGERRHDDTNFAFPSISAAGAGGGKAGLMIEIELT